MKLLMRIFLMKIAMLLLFYECQLLIFENEQLLHIYYRF
jgi:hypothetical protein